MLKCQEMLRKNIVMFLHSSYVEYVPLYQFLEKCEYIITHSTIVLCKMFTKSWISNAIPIISILYPFSKYM